MLTKRQRRQLKLLQSRHGRRKSDLFLVEGRRCCSEALQKQPGLLAFTVFGRGYAETEAGKRLRELAVTRDGSENIHEQSDSDMATLCNTETPQGVCCLMQRPEPKLPTTLSGPFSLVLDRVREPGNMGAMLRTAWAAGLRRVWLTAGCVDPFSPKVVRAGMGAHFELTLLRAGTLEETREWLLAHGRTAIYLAVPTGGVSCFSDTFKLRGNALVIGNEAEGIADLSLGPHVSIPMPGRAESLNASQAATILIFEAVRRGLLDRKAAPGPD